MWVAFISTEMQIGAFRQDVLEWFTFIGFYWSKFIRCSQTQVSKHCNASSIDWIGWQSVSRESIWIIVWPQHACEISFKTITRSFIAQREDNSFISVTIALAVKATDIRTSWRAGAETYFVAMRRSGQDPQTQGKKMASGQMWFTNIISEAHF